MLLAGLSKKLSMIGVPYDALNHFWDVISAINASPPPERFAVRIWASARLRRPLPLRPLPLTNRAVSVS